MATADDLTIPLEKLAYFVLKVREYDVKEAPNDAEDGGSNASDDGMVSVLEDHGDDPVRAELFAFINGLNDDEKVDLVALVWLGRGDGDFDDWDELRAHAAANKHRTARYLLGIPLVGDFVEEGLEQLGASLSEIETEML
ncbi:DUF3775 domain-containing protein [Zavarzinia sp.]|uniref:DUF3775 domain-containing protein n=1 Tax=Zavarzinia sp. TaxID=2027920 RepID=UPI003BB7940C|nr:DUF3775 domain-containing protein [Zavarzinia sp.]